MDAGHSSCEHNLALQTSIATLMSSPDVPDPRSPVEYGLCSFLSEWDGSVVGHDKNTEESPRDSLPFSFVVSQSMDSVGAVGRGVEKPRIVGPCNAEVSSGQTDGTRWTDTQVWREGRAYGADPPSPRYAASIAYVQGKVDVVEYHGCSRAVKQAAFERPSLSSGLGLSSRQAISQSDKALRRVCSDNGPSRVTRTSSGPSLMDINSGSFSFTWAGSLHNACSQTASPLLTHRSPSLASAMEFSRVDGAQPHEAWCKGPTLSAPASATPKLAPSHECVRLPSIPTVSTSGRTPPSLSLSRLPQMQRTSDESRESRSSPVRRWVPVSVSPIGNAARSDTTDQRLQQRLSHGDRPPVKPPLSTDVNGCCVSVSAPDNGHMNSSTSRSLVTGSVETLHAMASDSKAICAPHDLSRSDLPQGRGGEEEARTHSREYNSLSEKEQTLLRKSSSFRSRHHTPPPAALLEMVTHRRKSMDSIGEKPCERRAMDEHGSPTPTPKSKRQSLTEAEWDAKGSSPVSASPRMPATAASSTGDHNSLVDLKPGPSVLSCVEMFSMEGVRAPSNATAPQVANSKSRASAKSCDAVPATPHNLTSSEVVASASDAATTTSSVRSPSSVTPSFSPIHKIDALNPVEQNDNSQTVNVSAAPRPWNGRGATEAPSPVPPAGCAERSINVTMASSDTSNVSGVSLAGLSFHVMEPVDWATRLKKQMPTVPHSTSPGQSSLTLTSSMISVDGTAPESAKTVIKSPPLDVVTTSIRGPHSNADPLKREGTSGSGPSRKGTGTSTRVVTGASSRRVMRVLVDEDEENTGETVAAGGGSGKQMAPPDPFVRGPSREGMRKFNGSTLATADHLTSCNRVKPHPTNDVVSGSEDEEDEEEDEEEDSGKIVGFYPRAFQMERRSRQHNSVVFFISREDSFSSSSSCSTSGSSSAGIGRGSDTAASRQRPSLSVSLQESHALVARPRVRREHYPLRMHLPLVQPPPLSTSEKGGLCRLSSGRQQAYLGGSTTQPPPNTTAVPISILCRTSVKYFPSTHRLPSIHTTSHAPRHTHQDDNEKTDDETTSEESLSEEDVEPLPVSMHGMPSHRSTVLNFSGTFSQT